MNVLFMTIGKMDNIEEHTIYCDLLRYFRDAGHSVPEMRNGRLLRNYL